jgi:hypothetical protein
MEKKVKGNSDSNTTQISDKIQKTETGKREKQESEKQESEKQESENEKREKDKGEKAAILLAVKVVNSSISNCNSNVIDNSLEPKKTHLETNNSNTTQNGNTNTTSGDASGCGETAPETGANETEPKCNSSHKRSGVTVTVSRARPIAGIHAPFLSSVTRVENALPRPGSVAGRWNPHGNANRSSNQADPSTRKLEEKKMIENLNQKLR